MAERCKFKTSVGGQAVMEGIMMQGTEKRCLAVRDPKGNIVTEEYPLKKRPWAKIPLVRGVFSFISSLLTGYQMLTRSAEISMGEEFEDEEPGKVDRFVEKHFGDTGMKVLMGLSALVGVALAAGLFIFLPTLAVRLVDSYLFPVGVFRSTLEGLIKIAIFLCYLLLVGRIGEIRRTFCYHGAEHKTIACYEAGDALTVENIRPHTRFHPRCGTSFILIVLVVSILVNAVIPWPDVAIRTLFKLLLLPLIMGISYEILRAAGRYDNVVTRVVSKPGMWFQRLTTAEPDDDMIEVAIAAVKPVLPQNPEEAAW